MSKIPVKPTSRQAIWAHVRNIRRSLGVEDKLYFDIVHFVERVMPEIFPEFVFEVCTEAEMGNLHGETIPSEHKTEPKTSAFLPYSLETTSNKVELSLLLKGIT